MTGAAHAPSTHGWVDEHVLALARSPSQAAGAEAVAIGARWADVGGDESAVWGAFRGGGAEPYDVAVHHGAAPVAAARPGGGAIVARCSCPARVVPCKHALGLLLLWVRGGVPAGEAPPAVRRWVERALATAEPAEPLEPGGVPGVATAGRASATPGPERDPRDVRRDERAERVAAGLVELERWIADRVRTGLADPDLARYATWDALAARLVDAQAQGLANRVRRLGGTVGARAGWHGDLLAELGVLHALARAGRHLRARPDDAVPPSSQAVVVGSVDAAGSVGRAAPAVVAGPVGRADAVVVAEADPVDLADGVAAAVGWQVRQADVLAGVPDTDEWVVAGRSDVREDRIVVRRTWLWGRTTCRWAMVLSFAAYGQQLDESLVPGASFGADVHRYPGGARLRALVGRVHDPAVAGVVAQPEVLDVASGCDVIGRAIVQEPWLERHPVTLRVAAVRDPHGAGWMLSDGARALPIVPAAPGLGALVAVTATGPCAVTAEWTPRGMLPLALHLPDRTVDIGPRWQEGAA